MIGLGLVKEVLQGVVSRYQQGLKAGGQIHSLLAQVEAQEEAYMRVRMEGGTGDRGAIHETYQAIGQLRRRAGPVIGQWGVGDGLKAAIVESPSVVVFSRRAEHAEGATYSVAGRVLNSVGLVELPAIDKGDPRLRGVGVDTSWQTISFRY